MTLCGRANDLLFGRSASHRVIQHHTNGELVPVVQGSQLLAAIRTTRPVFAREEIFVSYSSAKAAAERRPHRRRQWQAARGRASSEQRPR